VENQITQPPPTDTPSLLETPAAVSQSGDTSSQSDAVIVIPRAIFNYVVIAIVFFALGAVVSAAGMNALFNANSEENRALITSMVDQVVSAQGSAVAQGLQAGQQYDITADDDPFRGPADAPVTIVEFSDFHCPYCKRFVEETLEPLMANFGDQVRIVFRDYPILGASSVLAALAGECADDQGAFWDFHDKAFADQQNLTRDAFISYATDLGLDVDTFTTCLDNQETMAEVQADYSYARNLGATGTPAFFINGVFVSGAQPYEVFADVINQQLNGAQESTPEPVASNS
jgi:protein-disulfide isomerase